MHCVAQPSIAQPGENGSIFAHASDYRRVLTTINYREPDRMPLIEMRHDCGIKHQFTERPLRDVFKGYEAMKWSPESYRN
jgi:hypothetical protein